MRADADSALLASAEALVVAMGCGGARTVDTLLTADFRCTLSSGEVLGRAAWIAHTTQHIRYEQLEVRDLTAVDRGGSGLLVYRLMQWALRGGELEVSVHAVVDVWRHQHGRWLLASRLERRLT
jgi:hypothetical protein